MELPRWIEWIVAHTAVPSALAAWTALFLALRRERRERPDVRFRFETTSRFDYTDQDNCSYTTPAIRVTATNTGLHSVSLEEFSCDAVFPGARPEVRRCSERFKAVTLRHGEAHSASVPLWASPADFKKASATDTTGKIWLARRSEVAQLRKDGRTTFGTMRSN